MHTLENELRELNTGGTVATDDLSRALALESRQQFSIHEELRVMLYLAVAALVAGIGLLLRAHLAQIGPLTLIIGIGLVAALLYAQALRAQQSGATRSLAGDYLLLLAALLTSADVGYAESQFHWLGADWSRQLLLLALFHGVTAYRLRCVLLLPVSILALAGWLGIETRFGDVWQATQWLPQMGLRGLGCAMLLATWYALHRHWRGPAAFAAVLEHFALHFAFWAALSMAFQPGLRLVGVPVVAVLVTFSIRRGLDRAAESLVVYGVAYGALCACVLEAQWLDPGLLVAVLMLLTLVGAARLLWQWHARAGEAP
jgi:hypothetical protein